MEDSLDLLSGLAVGVLSRHLLSEAVRGLSQENIASCLIHSGAGVCQGGRGDLRRWQPSVTDAAS